MTKTFTFMYEPYGSVFLSPLRISVEARDKEEAELKINSAFRRNYGLLREMLKQDA